MALNFAQVINNSNLAASIKSRMIDAVVYLNGYADTIEGPDMTKIPNPLTKVQFYNKVLVRYHVLRLKEYEVEPSLTAVRSTKTAEIDALGID